MLCILQRIVWYTAAVQNSTAVTNFLPAAMKSRLLGQAQEPCYSLWLRAETHPQEESKDKRRFRARLPLPHLEDRTPQVATEDPWAQEVATPVHFRA